MALGFSKLPWRAVLTAWIVLFSAASAHAQLGAVLAGAGPINSAMGGISAAPVDSLGALYWNPAVISGLKASEMEVGAQLLATHSNLSSALPANAFGPSIPPVGLLGSTNSSNGISPLPAIGLVYQPKDSILTYGFGMLAAGGFGVNYPGSTTNPVLTARPPLGVGQGPIYSSFQLMQIVPTISVRLTERLSFGFAPTIDLGFLSVDPGLMFASTASGYPAATHGETTWGAGFQTGLYYALPTGWHFGLSVKSPQWLDSFQFQSVNSQGQPETLKTRVDFPLIASAAIAYTGFDRWTLGADVREINYNSTPGFSHTGFDSTGAVRGLGWKNVFVLALGAQYRLADPLFLRIGYTYNTDPIPAANAIFNVATPVVMQHAIYLGGSFEINNRFLLSAAYAHVFENSIQGPLLTSSGPIPGASVQDSAWGDAYLMGATVKF